MRIMGLDYGSKTVGVALSDELLLTAQAREIIRRKEENKLRRTLARIEELIQEFGVEKIVLGLPLNMDQTPSERSQLCLEFKDKIERRTGIPVIMWDERLTTVEADEIMDANAIKDRRERKSKVDSIAAAVILQDFINEKAKG